MMNVTTATIASPGSQLNDRLHRCRPGDAGNTAQRRERSGTSAGEGTEAYGERFRIADSGFGLILGVRYPRSNPLISLLALLRPIRCRAFNCRAAELVAVLLRRRCLLPAA